MRKCPACSFEFSRAIRKDGIPTCPDCRVRLHYQYGRNKGTVLLEDKECVSEILTRVTLANQDFGANGSHRERHFAYELLERSKAFLTHQKVDIGLSYRQFLLQLIDYILQQEWWKEHLSSLLMLKNWIARFASEFYNKLADAVTVKHNTKIVSFGFDGSPL